MYFYTRFVQLRVTRDHVLLTSLSFASCFNVAKCIEMYILERVYNATAEPGQTKEIKKNLEAVVDRMFSRCFDDRQFKQVLQKLKVEFIACLGTCKKNPGGL